ncbi:MAG: hypothetical protein PVG39_26380 [Desulfobacteraceae bacterium]|jgi:hypothetical protein
MALLAEYVITPDVFDSMSYPLEELGDVCLQNLKEVMLHEALVRNLRDGRWLEVFKDVGRSWHKRGKELLKKLVTQNRLRGFTPVLDGDPQNDTGWCEEGIASHEKDCISGIISTSPICEKFPGNNIVAPIDKLQNAAWWQARSPSIRLKRATIDYQNNLNLILECSNSIMFIDPHLDPSKNNYREFIDIISLMTTRSSKPLIELHRVCYFGSGHSRDIISNDEWQEIFRGSLNETLSNEGMEADVFIWDDFHDRYLITDIIGIQLANGFDISGNSNSMTTWTRLGRNDSDDIQREFDPSSGRHKLRHSFKLPS